MSEEEPEEEPEQKSKSKIELDKENKRKRTVSEALKKKVASAQKFKCANSPGSNLKLIGDYKCHLYEINDGIFNESGWEIDHIIEFSNNGSDDISNLQALCTSCHKVKTKNFIIYLKQNNELQTIEEKIEVLHDMATVIVAESKLSAIKKIDKSKPNLTTSKKVRNPSLITSKKVSIIDKGKYKCTTCNYSTYRKTEYSRHILTKRHLEKINILTQPDPPSVPLPIVREKIFECDLCHTVFARLCNLSRHKTICDKSKIEKTKISLLEKENEILRKEVEEYKIMVKVLSAH